MANVTDSAPEISSGRERLFTAINKASGWLDALGFSWLVPILKMAAGDSPREQMGELKRVLLIPLLGILVFLVAWAILAPKVQTSLGAVPGPVQVWQQAGNLWHDHVREREKAAAFYERQDTRNAKLEEAGKTDRIKWRSYTGKPTYLDQIGTSLVTVGLGFLIATIFAVPLGIAS
ncbi:MAG: ABC transporter permease, partial [Stappiaceae bacterium]